MRSNMIYLSHLILWCARKTLSLTRSFFPWIRRLSSWRRHNSWILRVVAVEQQTWSFFFPSDTRQHGTEQIRSEPYRRKSYFDIPLHTDTLSHTADNVDIKSVNLLIPPVLHSSLSLIIYNTKHVNSVIKRSKNNNQLTCLPHKPPPVLYRYQGYQGQWFDLRMNSYFSLFFFSSFWFFLFLFFICSSP